MGRLSDSPRSIPRQLWTLAYPIIGINVLNVLMLAVDSALCGRLPNSQQALEALGFAVQVVFLLMVLMLGLLVGTVALVARPDTADYKHWATEVKLEALVQQPIFDITRRAVLGFTTRE